MTKKIIPLTPIFLLAFVLLTIGARRDAFAEIDYSNSNGAYPIEDLPPSAFNKISPSNWSTNRPTSLTLTWQAASPVTRYEYCFDTTNDNNCSNWIDNAASTSANLSGLNYSATYFWHVRAWNSSAGPVYSNGYSTAFWRFNTQAAPPQPPAAFNKSSLANGAANQPTSLTLIWDSTSPVTRYEYCYDTTDDNNCLNWISNSTSTSKALSGLSYSTTYYWHVRAWNGTGGPTYSNGDLTDFWSFSTQAAPPSPPAAFNKISPANYSTNQPISLTLSWQSTSPVTRYEYCIDTTNDSACSNWVDNGLNTSANLSGLGYSTTYYWHVRAWNGTGGPTYSNSGATAFRRFTTQAVPPQPPAAFSKSNPSNGASNQTVSLTLSWQTTSPVTRYEYCYDTTNDNSCSTWINNGTSTSKALSGLSYSTTYYWHVRAWNGTGGPTYSNGNPTDFWSFSTQAAPPSPPAAFNKISPANYSTNQPISLTLSWQSTSPVTRYEYCIDTTNNNSCSTWIDNSVSTSVNLSGLSYSTTYYWHVRAWNGDAGPVYSNGFSTAFWRFTTEAGSPYPTPYPAPAFN